MDTENQVRIFKVQNISGEETSIFDFIDGKKGDEPPLFASISLKDLEKKAKEGPIKWQFPCHTQNVERMIRSVSEAAANIAGFDRRDGFVRTKLKSRKEMPTFTFFFKFHVKLL